MQSMFVSRNQSHSQPTLPSQRSRYFQPAPQVFVGQGPAAMGFIPQRRHPGPQAPIVPLRKQFYDDSNRPTTNSQSRRGIVNTKSSILEVVPNTTHLRSQHPTTDKPTSSYKTTQQGESSASHSRPFNKRSIDACATNHETSRPPTRIRLVNRCTDQSKGSSQHTVASTSTQVNKHASQEYQPGQILPEALGGGSTNKSLNPISSAMGVPSTNAEPSRARELFQPRPIEATQNHETKTTSALPASILENPHRSLIDPSLYSHQDQSSTSGIPPPLRTRRSPIRDECDAPAPRALKRSASQATTVSSTSTEQSCTAENEDVPEEKSLPNPMSMIDETMILDRDLSDIVTTRLQEGKPDLLDTLYGEILIKMAVKDEGLFEAVVEMLKS
ncbi:hypothetical protein F4803DRAFT_514907 [Xylaria telfairii]|nr:hypothetical protein F4803DRAFT_514907 [Xylaria telfairii]